MSYTDDEVIKYMTTANVSIASYLVILGDDKINDVLYSIHDSVLFTELIDDDQMYLNCIDYIKRKGKVYKNREELKRQRPELIFG